MAAGTLSSFPDGIATPMSPNTLVILGSGYTARFVLPQASSRYETVLATSRDPAHNLRDLDSTQCLRFDLRDPGTWRHIPERADLLWCFPAAPLALVKQFSVAVPIADRRVVVLGSTSAYDVGHSTEYPPPWIDETAVIDRTKPRVQGEEHLRLNCGAIVLRVAGIYGPHRNPVDWINTGRVRPSPKYVNLIHVEDLASVCLAALEQGTSGETYNVSDGTPRTWEDICDTAQERWGLTPSEPSDRKELGKRISNHKLTHKLGYVIQHPDLYKELDSLSNANP